jgi:hypothetical protein
MTVLQELIKKWKIETGSYIPNAPVYKAFIEEVESYLEKEKQQIILAYEEANNKICESCWDCKIGEEYYNKTYNK